MKKRAKMKIELTATDKAIEFIGWFFILVIWILTIISYNKLPDIIPIHYSETGNADSFGGKAHILILPLIASILFVGLTILNKFPHIFNYPTNITKDNILKQYTNATRMIRYLKLIIVVIICFIAFRTIFYANGKIEVFGTWFLPLMIASILITLIYFIVKLTKNAS